MAPEPLPVPRAVTAAAATVSEYDDTLCCFQNHEISIEARLAVTDRHFSFGHDRSTPSSGPSRLPSPLAFKSDSGELRDEVTGPLRFGIQHLGDSALLITLGDDASEVTLARVRGVTEILDASSLDDMTEIVPGFRTVAVHYDAMRTSYASFADRVATLVGDVSGATAPKAREIQIPVLYGGELGPDLDHVAEHNGLSASEVIAIHQRPDYLVHMIGFAPGFPYLGGMSERIATPRRDTPRRAIPQGSVGIAGSQTGVYPIETPGGWQLIGRTPVPLFRPNGREPSLLRAGDRVRFVAIDRAQFDELESKLR